ncbi:hypothetical protein [Hydrogenophaga sp.]|uniref:hypothetical protein n=1 Tax=Hydrogenophaga sp. TaxID=1904254 RepID=UPI003F6BC8BB
MPAADNKNYLTDVASAETLLRLVQSVPRPKAEPIKLWLAKVGYERMQEMADPALSLNRARDTWQQHGRRWCVTPTLVASRTSLPPRGRLWPGAARRHKWIQQRMTGQETRNKLTDYWREHDIKAGQELAILTNIIHQEWTGVQHNAALKDGGFGGLQMAQAFEVFAVYGGAGFHLNASDLAQTV